MPKHRSSRARPQPSLQAAAFDRPALKPLVLALMTAMPMLAQAQSRVPVLPTVPANALPNPAAAWVLKGQGTWTVNGNAGVVNQATQRAIYQWQNYNIGKDASVTYQFNQAGSSALNRVVGGDPTQILGQLSSTVPGANGTRVTGGTVLLINPNGILFGAGAQVNTGGLIASTLNVGNDDYLSGFANSITGMVPTYFVDADGVALYTDDKSFVRVDTGAQITTASGGQVFLLAKNVENAGTISTPGGQTVMAAGSAVHLNDPSAEKLYASEVNSNVPALRGLLVEVAGEGRVLNTGTINTPRGNTTLVGMAVNQSGRISATTSVTENGSVFLLARSGVGEPTDDGSVIHKRATTGGTLTLGADSQVEITPETLVGADGLPLTIDGNTAFTRSRVELSGQTVVFEHNAKITAPGAVVNVRAEDTPFYLDFITTNVVSNTLASNTFTANSNTARVVLGEGAGIDVSGTQDTTVSVARNYVQTELIGGADLADAPLQRDGVLYRSKVTFDVRQAVNVLSESSVAGYKASIRKDASELLSAGGTVSLVSSGAVVTHQGSSVDVSGGQVTYTDAVVAPTYLIGADGQRYTVNTAPKDITYTALENAAGKTTRWAVMPSYGPVRSHKEYGYAEGQAAGTVNILAKTVVLDGQLQANTISGTRQQAGTDALAALAALNLGRSSTNAASFGSTAFADGAVLSDIRIVAEPGVLSTDFWAAPTAVNEDGTSAAALPAESRIAASTLNASGFGQVNISSSGHIVIDKGADLTLPQQGSLALRASGEGGIQLGGSVHSAGGKVLAQTANLTTDQQAGDIVLGEDAVLDVAGNWVNRYQDGAHVRAAVAGGSVRLLSAHGLDLEGNTLIDVSGGGTVATSGSVTGTSAGGIALESNRAVASTADTVAGMHLGAELRGYGISQGGSLRIKAAGVDIVAADGSPAVQEGETPATFTLSSDFFRQGGFASYDIEGADYLRVAEGTTLSPQAQNWIVGTAARTVATGTPPATWLSAGLLPEAQRKATNLTLSSTGLMLDGTTPSGTLTLARTAAIVADAGAKVSLLANAVLDVQGDITAPGGAVTLALQGRGSTETNASVTGFAGRFEVGPESQIDVSGKTVLDVTTSGLRTGKVLDGGSITLSVTNGISQGRQTRLDVAEGAVLRADGAQDSLDVTTRTLGGTVASRDTVASAGGTITVTTSDGGADLAGTLQARSASAQVAGGTLVIQQPSSPPSGLNQVVGEYRIDVSAQRDAAAAVALGQVRVAADVINAGGFADVTLNSPHRVHFDGDVTLSAGRSLAVKSLVVSASEGAQVQLTAPTSVSFESPAGSAAASYAAEGGTASLTTQAGMVRLVGDVAVQGIDQLALKADHLIQMESGTLGASGLRSQADVTLSAPQTVLATKTQYTIDAAGRTVTFTGGDAASTAPLSAGAALTVNAATIVQDGVLRVPLGMVTLNGTESVTLTGQSVTSVSGDGLVVPYGETTGGKTWTYLGTEQNALPTKAVNLLAPGQSVAVERGAVLDLSGGGSVQAAEFVPGPGGSTDAFKGAANGAFAVVPLSTLNTGYAAADAHTASQVDANGKAASTPIGQTITFGDGGPVPAGTYAVLPARYALLNGAFLVAPSGTSARVNLGYHATRTDGTVLVGAQLGSTGTTLASVATGFIVRTAAQAQQLSEMRLTDGDAYVAAAAQSAGTAVPRLAQDAGALNIAANQLVLAGTNRFELGDSAITGQAARAGGVAIAADRIVVRDSADMAAETPADNGSLVLDVAQLNATGADTITLGALRGDMQTTGRSLAVSAREVVLNNTAQALQAQDVVLAATEQVQLGSGAKVQAKAGTEPAETLLVQGDGALLRVSSDATATTVRTDAQRAAGVLDIGSGASVTGTSLTAEATASTRIASDAALQAQAYTLGAARVAVGDAAAIAAAGVGSDTLVISAALADRLSAAQAMTLRSYDSIDFYGNTTLGGAAQQALTLDAGTLRAMSPGAQVQVQAGGLTLTNTSGATATASGGDASLSFNATGAAGGSGVLTLGPGSVATGGAATTALNAQRSVELSGATGLEAGGDLQVTALSVTAHTGTQAKLAAQGLLQINAAEDLASATSNLTETTSGTGATLALTANQVVQAGTVRLASGQLSIHARGDGLTNEGDRTIELAEGSITDLAGKTFTFDGQAVSTSGGVFKATAQQGAVVLADGSLLDVSAGGTGARAGSVSLSATQGSLATDGTLLATSQAGAGLGGTLTLDSRDALSLSQLAQTLDNSLAQAAAGQENFGAAISARNRSGDQVLDADTTLKAQRLALSADSGRLDVQGTLDASGAQGGRIDLAAGQDVQVASGAVLRAAATGTHQAGGQVNVSSTAGRIGLASGATVDTRGTGTGANGKLALRAQRTSDGGVNDVAVDAINATLQGVRSVEVEAARTYTATTVNTALINTIQTDNSNFFGADNGAAMRERLAGDNAAVAQALSLRAGVEVQSAGNLTVSQAWNLSRFDADGNLANPGGAPVNLTLRAAGNLLVQAGLSSGFKSTSGTTSDVVPSAAVVGEGGTLRLVAGADRTAADVLQTVASDNAGDVIIGRSATDVLVRSTTGDLAIAAGRNVQLLNARAAVYTTGVAADAASLTDYLAPTSAANTLVTSGVRQSAMLQGGGSVSVSAGSDVIGASDGSQYATDWWWRGANGDMASWWSRYDKFKQGFGALGGGDVRITAGRDAVNVQAAAPMVGYVAPQASGLHTVASGNVSLQAGRDVLGGLVMAGGDRADVVAGRDVALAANGSGLQVLYSNTDVAVDALRDLTVGRVTDALLVKPINQNTGSQTVYSKPVTGTAVEATLRIVSNAGDVTYLGSGSSSNGGSSDVQVVPAAAVIAAPGGDLTVATEGLLVQAPATNSTLLLAAQGDVSIGESGVRVRGATAAQQTPGMSNVGVVSADPFLGDGLAAQTGEVQPVRIISQTGDIHIANNMAVATPLRMVAAGNITQAAGNLVMQHTQATDLSLIQAGGDVTLTNDGAGVGSWTVHGPGDLVVLAEGDVNFNQSGGLLAQGNRLNAALPAQSAHLTVLAGVHLQGGDYDVARQAVLELLSSADYAADLTAFVQARTGTAPANQAEALLAFTALPVEQQLLHMNRVLASELRAAGRAASTLNGAERDAAYERGYKALAALFPEGLSGGTVDMGASQIKTLQHSDITVHAPRGGLNVGQVTAGTKTADQLGIVTTAGGNITASVLNDIAVNRSRIFSVAQGDILLWASQGDIDAGRGAKTVTGAPPPVYRLVNGQIVVDTSGSYSGSGIAVLNEDSDLDLYAPNGEINAGDAGIKSAGNAFFGAIRFVGADNLQVGGAVSGGPPPVQSAGATAGLSSVGQSATSAGNRVDTNDDEDERRKRRARRNLMLEFLGFGEGT